MNKLLRNPVSKMPHTETTNVEQAYYRLIDYCAHVGKDQVIANGKAEHARYLMKRLFDVAEEKVTIYSGKFPAKVPPCEGEEPSIEVYGWKDLISSAMAFLKLPKAKLKILLDEPVEPEGHPFFEALRKNDLQGRVEVRIKDPAFSEPLAKLGHLFLCDDQGLRIETDRKEYRALANFGPKKGLVKGLRELVDKVFDHSDSVIDLSNTKSSPNRAGNPHHALAER